jgi:hypothetical protein
MQSNLVSPVLYHRLIQNTDGLVPVASPQLVYTSWNLPIRHVLRDGSMLVTCPHHDKGPFINYITSP